MTYHGNLYVVRQYIRRALNRLKEISPPVGNTSEPAESPKKFIVVFIIAVVIAAAAFFIARQFE